LRDRITTGGLIDDMRLGEIEIQHDARKTADVFYLAGVTESQRSNPEKAIRAMPEQVNLLEWHAIALATIG
jgi:hypothetical protein